MEAAENTALAQRDRQARTQILAHWLDVASRTLPQIAADLAESSEFLAVLRSPQSPAAAKLPAALAAAGASHLWALNESGEVRFQIAAAGSAAAELPLAPRDFVQLLRQTPNPRFFALHGGAVVEVCARARATAEPHDRLWAIVARPWDDAHLRTLGDLTESDVSLALPHEVAAPPATHGRLHVVRPLPDWQGNPLRVLRLDYGVPEFAHEVATTRRQSRLFVAFGLLLLVALGLALHAWVLAPLRKIEHSLGAQDPAPVSHLTAEKNELGRVADLVVSSFRQRSALEREIAERTRMQAALERSESSLRQNLEERARLGRDLHDGVIQSLYAAGMGLAGIRMQLHPEQTEAATRLEQTRAALNETIHDVRNFIIGLEPEALKLQTFSQAIAALLDVMRGLHAFRSTLDVDETLAARLTLAQRVHALQIAREAVSNAARHGSATRIHVALRLRGEFAEFEVRDDGRGFDTATVPQGKGLGNFAERARELGGELVVESQPGQGTRVCLTFSLLIL